MSGINKAIIIGYLGATPEIRYTPNGVAVTNFNVATNEAYKDKEGRKETRTEWHKIVAFGKLAEVCAEHLTKGKQVYIEGRFQTRSWTDQEDRKRQTIEIVASTMRMLGTKERKEEEGLQGGRDDDDVPF